MLFKGYSSRKILPKFQPLIFSVKKSVISDFCTDSNVQLLCSEEVQAILRQKYASLLSFHYDSDVVVHPAMEIHIK